jgi:hypothetical protein
MIIVRKRGIGVVPPYAMVNAASAPVLPGRTVAGMNRAAA